MNLWINTLHEFAITNCIKAHGDHMERIVIIDKILWLMDQKCIPTWIVI